MLYKITNAADMLPATKSIHDLSLLDNADMTTALKMALRNMSNEEKNTVITSEVTTCGTTRTARVTVAEYIEQAIYNQIVSTSTTA